MSDLKLNIGSGPVRFDGWTNVDFSDEFKPDIVADVTSLPYQDGSVCLIFASHVLEHIHPSIDVIKEWRRVLRVGGKLIVAVPDIAQMIAMYESGMITEQYFQATIYGAKRLGWDERQHTHERSYTPSMLMRHLAQHFNSLTLGPPPEFPRARTAGEIVACGEVVAQ